MLELANALRRRSARGDYDWRNADSGLLLYFLIGFSPLHSCGRWSRIVVIVGECGNVEQRSEGIDMWLGSLHAFDPHHVHAPSDEVRHLISNPEADQRCAQAGQNGNLS